MRTLSHFSLVILFLFTTALQAQTGPGDVVQGIGCGTYEVSANNNPGSPITHLSLDITNEGPSWSGDVISIRFRLAEANTESLISFPPPNPTWSIDYIEGSQDNGFYFIRGFSFGETSHELDIFVNEAEYAGGECVTIEVIDIFVSQSPNIPCEVTSTSDNASTCPTKGISGIVFPRLACEDFGNPDVLIGTDAVSAVEDNNLYSAIAEDGDVVSIDRMSASLAWDGNLVNVQDVVRLTQHLIGSIPLSNARQFIAANVANFGFEPTPVINNIDRSALVRAIFEDACLYTDPDNWREPMNWYFPVAEAISEGPASEAALAYPHSRIVTGETTGYNFSAVRIGDVFAANNCQSVVSTGEVAGTGPTKVAPRTVNVQTPSVTRTGVFDIDLNAQVGDRAVFGLSLGFDPGAIEIIGVSHGGVELSEDFLQINDKRGTLNLIAGLHKEDGTRVAGGQVTLTVRSLLPITDVESALWLADNPALNMAVSLDDASVAHPINLTHGQEGVVADLSVIASPNPFTTDLTLSVQVAEDGVATIELLDLMGRKLNQLSRDLPAGSHRVALPGVEQLPAGTYLYRVVDARGVVATGKVLKK